MLVSRGPTLFVDIGFDTTYDPALPNVLPVPGITGVQALVDTGASLSCIDNLLASQLNLPIVDRQPIAGAGGRHMANVYLAQLHVRALTFTVYGQFIGVDLTAGGQPHSALIGRTFLQHHTMIYEGRSGTVTLSR
jgi:predicted aspartyl protease